MAAIIINTTTMIWPIGRLEMLRSSPLKENTTKMMSIITEDMTVPMVFAGLFGLGILALTGPPKPLSPALLFMEASFEAETAYIIITIEVITPTTPSICTGRAFINSSNRRKSGTARISENRRYFGMDTGTSEKTEPV